MPEYQCFPEIDDILELLTHQKILSVSGFAGSALSIFVIEIAKKCESVLYITDKNNLERYGREITAIVPDAILIDENNPFFETANITIADEEFFSRKILVRKNFDFKIGTTIDRDELLALFSASGLQKEEIVEEEGEFAVRGGIIDFFAHNSEPVRFELDGDKIVSIRKFNPLNQRSFEILNSFSVKLALPGISTSLSNSITEKSIVITEKKLNFDCRQLLLNTPSQFSLSLSPAPKYFGNLRQLHRDMDEKIYTYKFLFRPSLIASLESILGPLLYIPLPVKEGFIDLSRKIVFLSESDVYGTLPKKKPKFKGLFIDDLKGLKHGDYVVHNDFGIGQFTGLTEIDFEGKKVECLRIDYAEGDKVYLPVEKMNLIERYIGYQERPPRLSKIGGELWIKTKEQVKKATEFLARELINLYARRQLTSGFAFSPDSFEMAELEAGFPFEETPDQKKAIEDVKRDMESPRPQERLICGDVGFGKTEIAIRAAFKAALDSKQTMILCPTTILAFQHYNTFTKRLREFPVRVEMVSRFQKRNELKRILKDIAEGKVDIIIGTHRLLAPDVVFKDLGLLIIDEEHRFGVMQKDKIKKIKSGIDVIYLSATPIPRTLYMSLAGIKDITVMYTPPRGRKEIITKIIHFDDEEIKKIIQFEMSRGGQIFFVHNRIQTIEMVRERLQRLLPELRICVLHGKINSQISERKMIEFLEGKYDLLLATAIIESGIDMPNVNTIIVNEADRFGLADLHQLRGRVGRSEIQGYAYFIIPSRMTDEAKKRLSALVSYTTLGSGFRLAIRDMEIRGVGNILGKEQSGYINAIGYHHYVKILNNVLCELQGREFTLEPILNLKIPSYIPSDYVASPYERTAIYKRLMEVQSEYELKGLQEELIDRFGKYPDTVENLFTIAKIRLMAISLNAQEVQQIKDRIRFFSAGKLLKEVKLSAI
ncbi:MAG: transcription-repair coupling factor [candidate division WOR-3 bacterium]|nr:transcription-repair coupling factor [candidate division WOR-3 bacterium]